MIGVVTSPTGAVIRDILHRLSDRFPSHVLVWPVLVQGETAKDQVAAAIEGFNRMAPGGAVPRPDLLIVARGGGSLEDLWAFNEEIVVRAAAASEIPLISAVGRGCSMACAANSPNRKPGSPALRAALAIRVQSSKRRRRRWITAGRRRVRRRSAGSPGRMTGCAIWPRKFRTRRPS